MTQLTKRQEYLLGLIVREYVKSPSPVSSKALVDGYRLDVSSATVRNDMAELEEKGLLYAPHTSAGRVPSEAGYRYFVQRQLANDELSAEEQRTIQHQFHQFYKASFDVEQWLRLAASVLSQTAHTASVVTAPEVSNVRFKHIELICTQGRIVLMVLVLEGGTVRQQMLSLAEPVTQPLLSGVTLRINGLCNGKEANWIKLQARHHPTLDQEIMELAADLMLRASQRHHAVYFDGLSNILDPNYLADRLDVTPADREEFTRTLAESDNIGARQTLHLLQEQGLLEDILAEALHPGLQGVQVMIAGDGRWEELSHTSMILSRYGHDQASGALGILGPTRLHYGRAIAAVRYVAGLMTDIMVEVYSETDKSVDI